MKRSFDLLLSASNGSYFQLLSSIAEQLGTDIRAAITTQREAFDVDLPSPASPSGGVEPDTPPPPTLNIIWAVAGGLRVRLKSTKKQATSSANSRQTQFVARRHPPWPSSSPQSHTKDSFCQSSRLFFAILCLCVSVWVLKWKLQSLCRRLLFSLFYLPYRLLLLLLSHVSFSPTKAFAAPKIPSWKNYYQPGNLLGSLPIPLTPFSASPTNGNSTFLLRRCLTDLPSFSAKQAKTNPKSTFGSTLYFLYQIASIQQNIQIFFLLSSAIDEPPTQIRQNYSKIFVPGLQLQSAPILTYPWAIILIRKKIKLDFSRLCGEIGTPSISFTYFMVNYEFWTIEPF